MGGSGGGIGDRALQEEEQCRWASQDGMPWCHGGDCGKKRGASGGTNADQSKTNGSR